MVDARYARCCSGVTRGKPSRRVSVSSIALNQGWRPTLASSAVTPGFSRPNACIQKARRSSTRPNSMVASRAIMAGIHSMAGSPTSMPRKPDAATPITVIGCLLTRTLRPTTSSAPARRFCQ